jgi:hypothetical protein
LAARVTQAGDLTVRDRIAQLHALVVTLSHDIGPGGQHRANRDTSSGQAGLRLRERGRHHLLV